MYDKYTIERVKLYAQQYGGDCISTSYKKVTSKLKFLCPKCNKIFEKDFYTYKQSNKLCRNCNHKPIINITYIKNYAETIGGKCLSEDYKNQKNKLKFVCNKCSKVFYKQFTKYRQSNGICQDCNKKKRVTIDYIKEFTNNLGDRCISNEYIPKKKLKFISKTGIYFEMDWKHYRDGHRPKDEIYTFGSVNNIAYYDLFFEKLNWCEEVRRDPKNIKLLQVKCIKCGEWFTPTYVQVIGRLNAIKTTIGESRFYCSDGCKNSCSIFHQKLYPKGFKVDRSREVQPELAAMVFKRDSYECQRCGNKDNLECHHYEGVEQNPIESADIDMCVTLCEVCHNKAHDIKGCRYIDLTKNMLCK